jgi:hypothetical protein
MRAGESTTKSRTLHLVDLENLLGDRRTDAAAARAGLVHYLRIARWQPGDHVVVAAHHEIVKAFAFDKPVPCSVHAVCGPDAADDRLLAEAPAERVGDRYGRLVIGSGDGKFLQRAREVRGLGVGVLVVATARGCAAGFGKHSFPVLEFDVECLATLANNDDIAARGEREGNGGSHSHRATKPHRFRRDRRAVHQRPQRPGGHQ